jgi:hypothetical protein
VIEFSTFSPVVPCWWGEKTRIVFGYIEDLELTSFLVESGAELNAIYEEKIDGELMRQTPLDVAIYYQNREIIAYLESQGGKKAAELGSIMSSK